MASAFGFGVAACGDLSSVFLVLSVFQMLDPSLLASPIVQAFGGLGLVLWIAQLLFTTSIAQAKGLNWFFWGLGALLFPLLAFLAVLGMPDRKQRLLMRQLGEQLLSIKETGVRLHDRSSHPKFSRPAPVDAAVEPAGAN